jgi:hypothetical protein
MPLYSRIAIARTSIEGNLKIKRRRNKTYCRTNHSLQHQLQNTIVWARSLHSHFLCDKLEMFFFFFISPHCYPVILSFFPNKLYYNLPYLLHLAWIIFLLEVRTEVNAIFPVTSLTPWLRYQFYHTLTQIPDLMCVSWRGKNHLPCFSLQVVDMPLPFLPGYQVPDASFSYWVLTCICDAQKTHDGISDAQGPWACSENESRGRLQQQRLERFCLWRREEKDCIVGNAGGPGSQWSHGFYSLFCALPEGVDVFQMQTGISWEGEVSPWPPVVHPLSPLSQWLP